MHCRCMRRILAVFLTMSVVLSLFPTGSFAAVPRKVRVKVWSAAIYKVASTKSEVICTVSQDKIVICGATKGNWAYVRYDGKTGYMLKSTLSTTLYTETATSDAANDNTDASKDSDSVICYAKEATALYNEASTAGARVGYLKKGEKVLVLQVKNSWAKIRTANGALGLLPSSKLSKTKVKAEANVVLKDWFASDIQYIFPVGSSAKVIDVATRKSFTIKRKGGHNHADVEPSTADDTRTMLQIYGGQFSWARRAIWVEINGVLYAASMNGMGHGESTVEGNNLNGHFCIHFQNSRTHETDHIDPDHQAAVMEAYSTAP